MNVIAIILARGGSKGIPKKNIIDFCGKPLIAWTIEHCINAKGVNSVWVSSDSEEILNTGEKYGAKSIFRPDEISGDTATSESGWLHGVEYVSAKEGNIDLVVAPQITSPIRTSKDIESGIELFKSGKYDSLFSCSLAEDIYFWQHDKEGKLNSINYDWKNRKRRQDHSPQFIENGSFYLFTPYVLKKYNNRFGKSIGMVEMEFYKMYEIDSLEGLKLCEAIMKSFIIDEKAI